MLNHKGSQDTQHNGIQHDETQADNIQYNKLRHSAYWHLMQNVVMLTVI
jgi:hypothetical protein